MFRYHKSNGTRLYEFKENACKDPTKRQKDFSLLHNNFLLKKQCFMYNVQTLIIL